MSKLINMYRLDLKKKKIFYDENQELAIYALNDLFKLLLVENKRSNSMFFSDIFKILRKDMYFGLYIWGNVGRGKTYLVDLFYLTLSIKKKKRLHFHHFMKIIHTKLKENFGKKNPLKFVAKWFYDNYIIICLDEFFIKDIADAMSLSNLFLYFFKFKIYFVITSNIIPDKLYEGGLQRQRFIPTINILKKYLKIINIDGKLDYRSKDINKNFTIFHKTSIKSFKYMKNLFLKLAKKKPKRKFIIELLNRNFITFYVCDNIIWLDFNIICGPERSQLDYIEIASMFSIVFLSNVTKMSCNDEDKARRFISLIDELYDKKIKLIMSSNVNIKFLYNGNILNFDFQRTLSRLNEMSSEKYFKNFNKNVF